MAAIDYACPATLPVRAGFRSCVAIELFEDKLVHELARCRIGGAVPMMVSEPTSRCYGRHRRSAAALRDIGGQARRVSTP